MYVGSLRMRVWKGNEDLRGMLYALAFLDEDQENARIHPPENLAARLSWRLGPIRLHPR